MSNNIELEKLRNKMADGDEYDAVEEVEIQDQALLVVSIFEEWNEIFIDQVVGAVKDLDTDTLYGVSYAEGIPPYDDKFCMTVEIEPDNPRKYSLLYGRIIGLTPTLVATMTEELPEESDDPVEVFANKVKDELIEMSNYSEFELNELLGLSQDDDFSAFEN